MGASKKKHNKKVRAERRLHNKSRRKKRKNFFEAQPAQVTSAVPLGTNRVDKIESLGLARAQQREHAI